jgi:hypothetical protein
MKRYLTFALALALCAFSCQGCFTLMALASMSDDNSSTSTTVRNTTVSNPVSNYIDVDYLSCTGNSSSGRVTIKFLVTSPNNYFPFVEFAKPDASDGVHTYDSDDYFSTDVVSDESTTVELTLNGVPAGTMGFTGLSVLVRLSQAQKWEEIVFNDLAISWH